MTAARLAVLRGARGAHDHPGAPVPAPVLPLAAPVRDPVARAADLRDERPGLPRRRRTLELSPLTIARLHGRSPRAGRGAERRRAARARARGRARARDHAQAGPHAPAPAGHPAPALARAGALQRPAQDPQGPARRPPPRLRDQPVGLGRRQPRRLRAVPPEAPRGAAAGRDRRRLARPAQRARHARQPPAAPRADEPLDPRSAYNATVSGDGRFVAYESSPGNVNFAKRYGRIGVHLADAARGRTTRIDHPPRGEDLSQSAYNPQLAADGRHLAFQAVRGAGTAQVFVCDLHTGGADAGQRRPAPRAARDHHLDLRAARVGRRALRGLHGGHEPRRRRRGPRRPRASSCATCARGPRRRSATALPASHRIRPCRPTAAASPSPRGRPRPSSTSATWPRTRPRR